MNFTQKITKLKKVSIVPFLFASIPFAFIYLFLRDIPFLSSLFIDYVDSGNSLFFPSLYSPIIAFQFTTGHLIDIIIVINIVAFLERGGYYYVNACLKRNYLEMNSELVFLDTHRTREDSSRNSELPLGLKRDTSTIVNEGPIENNFETKSRIKINHIGIESGYYRNSNKVKHNQFNSLRNFRKKNTLNNNFYPSFQYCSTNHIIKYHFPSTNNCISSNSIEIIQKVEGR